MDEQFTTPQLLPSPPPYLPTHLPVQVDDIMQVPPQNQVARQDQKILGKETKGGREGGREGDGGG